jgi:hypothetical protein
MALQHYVSHMTVDTPPPEGTTIQTVRVRHNIMPPAHSHPIQPQPSTIPVTRESTVIPPQQSQPEPQPPAIDYYGLTGAVGNNPPPPPPPPPAVLQRLPSPQPSSSAISVPTTQESTIAMPTTQESTTTAATNCYTTEEITKNQPVMMVKISFLISPWDQDQTRPEAWGRGRPPIPRLPAATLSERPTSDTSSTAEAPVINFIDSSNDMDRTEPHHPSLQITMGAGVREVRECPVEDLIFL